MNLGLWPILLIVAAIAGLIALFYNWDSVTAWFGKQWGRFTSWIGEAWDNVVKWFKEFDFKAFFKDIGQSILKFLLTPMTMMLKLASSIPGKVGDMASGALAKIGELTGDGEIGVTDKRKPLDSPELNSAKVTRETIQRNNLAIDINDPGNNVRDTNMTGPMPIPVRLTNTQGAF